MNWHITFAQSLGAQSDQEDSGGAWLSLDGNRVFVVLADGAGGHRGGRLASQTAVDVAQKFWSESAPDDRNVPAFLDKITRAAHDAVAALPKSEHSCRTTWVALIAGPENAHWVHSGDSRLYHFVDGSLKSRTLDHSLVQMLIESGKVDAAEATTHPDRSTLLQSLGGPDFHPPEHGSVHLSMGDLFILCTDGVWSALKEDAFSELAACPATGRQGCVDALVKSAVDRTGVRADNASLWCIARE
jgi:serine/threonine protein phosphatase PrpC